VPALEFDLLLNSLLQNVRLCITNQIIMVYLQHWLLKSNNLKLGFASVLAIESFPCKEIKRNVLLHQPVQINVCGISSVEYIKRFSIVVVA